MADESRNGRGITKLDIFTRGRREYQKQIERWRLVWRYTHGVVRIVTIEYACKRWHRAKATAKHWLAELCDCGLAERLAPGIFRLIPLEDWQ